MLRTCSLVKYYDDQRPIRPLCHLLFLLSLHRRQLSGSGWQGLLWVCDTKGTCCVQIGPRDGGVKRLSGLRSATCISARVLMRQAGTSIASSANTTSVMPPAHISSAAALDLLPRLRANSVSGSRLYPSRLSASRGLG
ncbi:hypothetical protein CKAN_02336100 [Cinnamomum micranthum f. kanehirae]|uniref:Uncharacterized protein n=1 Tax=Cinnamomum micranthum f. kanehirae TaxID=337451 RepID=A0A443PTI2_9MAGN|nr:hypothetical protein CKAN_02336100 [Cinnamomum micranthum f. kanehirae]